MSSSPARFKLILADLAATQAFAARIAAQLDKGDVVLLDGNLGAGKTELARGIIRAATGKEQAVTSPTFSLVQPYEAKGFTLYHYDLYRLKSPHELVELGLEEALAQGAVLAEWPDIANAYWPKETLEITLEADHATNARTALLVGTGGKWSAFVRGL